MPSVSVIIPTYNNEQTLAQAVQSVFDQTVLPNEIIIVDDGSTDGTAAVAKRLEGSIPVRYTYQANARQAVARNHGVRLARSEWLAFLDADDYWLPGKLKTQLEALAADADLRAVIGNYRIQEGRTERTFVPDVVSGGAMTPATLLAANFFSLPAVLVQKAAYWEIGGIDEQFRNAEDVDFGFRFCKQFKYQFIPEVVTVYQRRPFSSSQQEGYDIAGLLQFYRRVLIRADLTENERRIAQEKQRFWRLRQRTFLVRRDAVLHGQIAGLHTFFRKVWPKHLSVKALALGVLLLVPGSIRWLKRHRWQHLDFTVS